MHCVFDVLTDYEGGLVVLAGLHDICTAAVAIPFQRRNLEVSFIWDYVDINMDWNKNYKMSTNLMKKYISPDNL